MEHPPPVADRSRAKVFRRKEYPRAHTHPHHASGAEPKSNNRLEEEGRRPGAQYNHNGHLVTKGVQPDGESGRKGFHPWKFLVICFKSSCTASMLTNFLWPFTIAALVLHFAYRDLELWIFITAYAGMIPSANLIGFAGQELARKLPTVFGVVLETTFGSVVEITLFMVLIKQPGNEAIPVIRAAILGSILANLLLCLGLCFFVGGIFHPQQTFHEAISEVGSNLMLVAGLALVIPTIYYNSLSGNHDPALIESQGLQISRATAIVLLIAFVVYLFFQVRSHHGLYEVILRSDEEKDHDRWMDLTKDKLTFTEACVAVVIGITFVSFMAVFLVQEIEYIRGRHISDSFIGLILIPVVEKAAEHITAMDEAYDNQMNFALSHVLGASIQTALLNTPLVVLVGWGLGKDMSLNFELFDAVLLILAIIVVGNFLRDEKSDYLEGCLSVFVYVLIAVTAWYYPDPTNPAEVASGDESGSEATAVVAELAKRLVTGS